MVSKISSEIQKSKQIFETWQRTRVIEFERELIKKKFQLSEEQVFEMMSSFENEQVKQAEAFMEITKSKEAQIYSALYIESEEYKYEDFDNFEGAIGYLRAIKDRHTCTLLGVFGNNILSISSGAELIAKDVLLQYSIKDFRSIKTLEI